MCGITPDIQLMDGVLAIETGAREHFRRVAEHAEKRRQEHER